ncbi:MAG: hypothetical protein LBK42_06635 [Propionibacteriaceae bacterium]|jgi:hypothetical protein|nr:hypothetical protein [Propionibacteriaceae bacterium]
MESDWSERRQAAARQHAAALAAAQAVEQAKAHRLLVDFVDRLRTLGLPPVPLTAVGYSGGRYRTQVRGWYLRANASLGVDAAANYYILQVPGGWAAKLTGVTLEPSPPPLVVGRGGRDGESIDLDELLALRLVELTAEAAGG